MGKLIVLKFGAGNFETGFSVTLQIGEEASRPFSEITGELPPDPELLCYFNDWQAIYRRLDFSGRPIGLPKATSIATVEECDRAAEELCDRFNTWLQANSFRPIREKWLEKLLLSDVIRVILQTQDAQLQKLPWHLWDFLAKSSRVEILYHSIHYIDLVRNLLGNPRSVYAKTTKHPSMPQLAVGDDALAGLETFSHVEVQRLALKTTSAIAAFRPDPVLTEVPEGFSCLTPGNPRKITGHPCETAARLAFCDIFHLFDSIPVLMSATVPPDLLAALVPDAARLLFGLGIRHVGAVTARDLMKNFHELPALRIAAQNAGPGAAGELEVRAAAPR